MNLQEALKIRAVVPCAELRIARHFARVWKRAAKKYLLIAQEIADISYNNVHENRAHIVELEDELRHAANTLEDAGLPLNAERARELLGETK